METTVQPVPPSFTRVLTDYSSSRSRLVVCNGEEYRYLDVQNFDELFTTLGTKTIVITKVPDSLKWTKALYIVR